MRVKVNKELVYIVASDGAQVVDSTGSYIVDAIDKVISVKMMSTNYRTNMYATSYKAVMQNDNS